MADQTERKDYTDLVTRLQAGAPNAIQEFYEEFARPVRLMILGRTRGPAMQDIEDLVHKVLFQAIAQVQQRQIREPKALFGYVRIIAIRETVWWQKKQNKQLKYFEPMEVADWHTLSPTVHYLQQDQQNPERQMRIQEEAQLLTQALIRLKPQEREILERFYLDEQTPQQIMAAMRLTETQYRLHKSRAKQRCAEVARKLQQPAHEKIWRAPRAA